MVVTSCTAIPQPNKKYSQQHEDAEFAESPIKTVDRLTDETKRVLRDRRKMTANYKKVGQDDLYVVESIEDISKHKAGMSEIPMYVDECHVRNHIDPWCIVNCDPTKIKRPR